ncbi:hypothetical protein [Acinetobacter bereziniae]|uniref:hypothetical protein n=1 Tax=Acinetobacter bereziniae TaxID=106648 RepID=UPI002EB1AFED|nr:hypothetical protein [Pseudomonadota bacterium]
MLITKADAEKLLSPYTERILNVFNLAWNDWLKRIEENPSCCKRGRSNFIWDQIIHHAKNEFSFEPDHKFAIYPYNNSQTYNFIVEQQLVFRIKKGKNTRKSSNVPTNMSKGFHDPNESLPEIGLLPRIEIQYELDKLESAIIDVVAVARNRNLVAWETSLKYRGNDELPIFPTIPVNPKSPSPITDSSVKKRVKLKSVNTEKEQKKIVGE